MFTGSTLNPVAIFEKYIEHLNPNCNRLWQWLKNNVTPADPVWFEKAPVGHTKIGNFMKELSEKVKLSKVYTNHSIQATCITKLDQANFESRHIMAVSSHKSESTVKTYAKKCPESKKREMSETLTESMGTKRPCPGPSYSCLDLLNVDLSEVNAEELIKSVLEETTPENKQTAQTGQEVVVALKMPMANMCQSPVPGLLPAAMNVQNTVNNKQPTMPMLYFPQSNVTINYNYS